MLRTKILVLFLLLFSLFYPAICQAEHSCGDWEDCVILELNTEWGQSPAYEFYYDYEAGVEPCSFDVNASPTPDAELYNPGCVAIAVAQLINYYYENGYRDGWLDTVLKNIHVYPRFPGFKFALIDPFYEVVDCLHGGYPTLDSYPPSIQLPSPDQKDSFTQMEEDEKALRQFIWNIAIGMDSKFEKNEGDTGVGAYPNTWPQKEEPYSWVDDSRAKIQSLLIHRLRFNPFLIHTRELQAIDEEREYIIESLNRGDPVLLSMSTKSESRLDGTAHAVVIFGYRRQRTNCEYLINMGYANAIAADGDHTNRWYDGKSDIVLAAPGSEGTKYEKFWIYEDTYPAAGKVDVPTEINVSPSPVALGSNIQINAALEEKRGFDITYEKIGIAIVGVDYPGYDYDIKTYENVTIFQNDTWMESVSEVFPSDYPPGRYKVVLRGQIADDKWFDFPGPNNKEFTVIEPDEPATSHVAVSSDIAVNPSPVILNEDFTISFSLKETNGSPKTFENLVVAILDGNGDLVFPFVEYSNVTLNANETLLRSATNKIFDSHPPGTYQAVIRAREPGGDWFDLGTVDQGLNPKVFQVNRPSSTPTLPEAVLVSPTTGNWDDSPQFINLSSRGAERIYCTVRTKDDGSTPEEPPEPTVEVHDAFNQNMDQFIGPSGQFEVWAEPGDYKVVKVRFRAHNGNGYGPATGTYTYRIDRTQEVAPDTDKPDLIVRDLYLNHDEDSEDRITRFALGEDIRINTRVKNIGGADVEEEVKIEYYLSPGEHISPSTWEYIGKDFLDEDDLTVRSSGYDDYDYSSDDPLPQAPGIYNITVVADTLGDIDEENENNNMFDPPLVFEIYDPNAQQPGPGTGPTTTNIDSALIIDSSGSMDQNDPTQNRLEAARFFIDRADPGDHICVVDFDGSAAVNPAMGTLRDAGSNRGILKDAVNLIDSNGGTNIGEGLRVGYQELSRSPTGNQKIAILLTDGQDSGGENNREALDYQAQGWRVFTIGLGSGADEERLIEIAQTTGGDYFAVTTEQAAQNAITEIYKRISRTVNQTELTIHQELFMVSVGEIVERFFDVLPGTESLAVDRIIPGSDVEMILVKPDGTMIDRQTQSADVYHALGATYEIYKVENPMPGRWIMRLRGIETLPGGEPTNVSIAVDHPEKELYLEGIFNMNVPEGDTAILRGANPLNIDDDIVSYRWVLVSKSSDRLPDPVLSDPYSANPTFTVPEVGRENGTYVYHCITTDGQGFESTEVYTVNIVNDGPGDDGEFSVSSSSCFLDALF